jgi:hypothetical protein
MQQYVRGGFIVSDGLAFEALGEGFIFVRGTIGCAGGLYIDVEKILEIVGGEGPRTMVQTISYTYNAAIEGVGNVFRYDSPHAEDHRPFHHVHRYDVLAGDRDGTVEGSSWPTLGAVIGELQDWFYEHIDELTEIRTRGHR